MASDIPEIDALIVDQMDDETLLKYCQVHRYAQSICLIPRIKRRIDLYIAYKQYNPKDDVDKLNQQPRPIMFYSKHEEENEDEYRLDYNFIVMFDDQIQQIGYFTGYNLENDGIIKVEVKDYIGYYNVNDVMQLFQSDRPQWWLFDIESLYFLYYNKGFRKYAKNIVRNLIDYMLKQFYSYEGSNSVNRFKRLLNLFGLYLWFQYQCHCLGIIVEYIDYNIEQHLTKEYIESVEAMNLITQWMNQIQYYYGLLEKYIDNL